jgi:heme/copper-type cytochrome/quinol oxidase subunit 2
MNKKIMKNLLSFALVSVGGVLLFGLKAHALDVGINEITNTIQLGASDPREIVARIINTAMMFLGIIAVVIILLGGFKWMTAAGNEDKVSEAKQLMGAGVIGLVIILASWGIASFVLNQLINATGN